MTTTQTTEKPPEQPRPVDLRTMPVEVPFDEPGTCRCGSKDTQFLNLGTGKRRCCKCASGANFMDPGICVRYH